MASSWLAWRYFWRGRERYLPLLTTTAIAGVALGIFALTVVLSVMRGFTHELTARLLGFNAHITIRQIVSDAAPLDLDVIRGKFGDRLATIESVVEGEAIAVHHSDVADAPVAGLKLRGVDLPSLGDLPSTDLYFPEAIDQRLPRIVLGHEAAGALLVHPDFEDELALTAPLAKVGPTGELLPASRSFRVAGIFRSGIYEYDSKVAFIDREEAVKLLGEQGTPSIRIRLHDPAAVNDVVQGLSDSVPNGYEVVGWGEQNRKLFGALKLERMAMTVILATIVLIASFSITGTMLLVTTAKRKDIAMLKALGMERRRIIAAFLWHGSIIGALGALLGIILGIVACLVLQHWPLSLPSAYYLDRLPVELSPLWIFSFGIFGWLLAVAASLYPVVQSVAEDPCEVLRYE